MLTAPPGTSYAPEAWEPDGRVLLFRVSRKSAPPELWQYEPGSGRSAPFGHIESETLPNATFSPDGHLVAYMVRRPDAFVIEAQPVPPTGARHQLATGIFPLWSRREAELFNFHDSGQFAGVHLVRGATGLSVRAPQDLWRQSSTRVAMTGTQVPSRGMDAAPGGDFIALIQPAATGLPEVQVVLNWLEDFTQHER